MKYRHLALLFCMLIFMASGCSGETPGGAPPSPMVSNHLKLLPEASNFVMYMNLNAMLETELGKELSAEWEHKADADWDDDAGYRDFVNATGLDMRKDIYEVWLCATPTNDEDSYEEELGGAIIRGKFDRDRINEYIRVEKRGEVRESDYRGFTIYEADNYDRDKRLSYTFLNEETAIVGERPWLESVIDRSEDGGSNLTDNSVMTTQINEIPRKDHLWGVINVDRWKNKWLEEVRRRGSSFKGTKSIEKMKSFVFYTHLDTKADVNLKGIFTNQEEADLFAEMLSGFKAMAKLMVSDDREAIDMLNEIKVQSSNNTVSVSGRLGREFVQKVQQKQGSFGGSEFKLL